VSNVLDDDPALRARADHYFGADGEEPDERPICSACAMADGGPPSLWGFRQRGPLERCRAHWHATIVRVCIGRALELYAEADDTRQAIDICGALLAQHPQPLITLRWEAARF
jgi:hypothetical protein